MRSWMTKLMALCISLMGIMLAGQSVSAGRPKAFTAKVTHYQIGTITSCGKKANNRYAACNFLPHGTRISLTHYYEKGRWIKLKKPIVRMVHDNQKSTNHHGVDLRSKPLDPVIDELSGKTCRFTIIGYKKKCQYRRPG